MLQLVKQVQGGLRAIVGYLLLQGVDVLAVLGPHLLQVSDFLFQFGHPLLPLAHDWLWMGFGSEGVAPTSLSVQI